jgi:dihydrofolate reductase
MTSLESDIQNRLLYELDIRAIAAMDEAGIIGNENSIPWNIPEEMAFFRTTTQNSTVLMGRRTFESIGHPLPHRKNIVMTKNLSWKRDDVIIIEDVMQLFDLGLETTVWVCGGATIYKEFLPVCRELYLSIVNGEHVGDVKFPEFVSFFVKTKTILSCPSFKTEHYVNKQLIG